VCVCIYTATSHASTKTILCVFMHTHTHTHTYIHIYTIICMYTYIHTATWNASTRTEWRRCIECLELRVFLCKRDTFYGALLWKMTHKDQASYGSSPFYIITHTFYTRTNICISIHMCIHEYVGICIHLYINMCIHIYTSILPIHVHKYIMVYI